MNAAEKRRLANDCVHCGFCLPTCPTYVLWNEEMDSPRGRIDLISGHLDGALELNDTVVQHFDRCLGCMACLTSCPSGVAYDRLIESTRAEIEETHSRAPIERTIRALVFAVFPHPRRLRAALALEPLGRKLPLPRPLTPLRELAPPWRSRDAAPPVTAARGPRVARVGLLTGCVQRVLFGDVNAATARVLAADGVEVIAPNEQSCCGALSLHAGRLDEGRERARRLIETFERAQVEQVVTNAAGCGSTLKEYGTLLADDPEYAERAASFSSGVRDIAELLVEVGPRARRNALALDVAFQDSCHLLHAQRVREAPRTVLSTIPELRTIEPAEQELCCGSAGIYNITQPDAARELGERKAANVLACRPDAYASANPGCLVQVSGALRRAGRSVPTLHPIELVDASIRGVSPRRLLISARR